MVLYALTLKIWFKEFQRGCKSVFDDPRSRDPKIATMSKRNSKKFIQRSKIVVSSTKHKPTGTYQRLRDSQKCGLHPENLLYRTKSGAISIYWSSQDGKG